MRRITLWIISTVAALVLLFSYRTSLAGAGALPRSAGSVANAPGIVSGPALDGSSGPSAQPGTQASGGASPGATPKSTGAATGRTVVNGTVAQTRWGPVQVQVTIESGKITDIQTLQVPNGNFRDQEINSYAVPQLREQVLAAQSAQIDGVGGATVTSDGYIQSLQAALDAAHFKG